MYIYWLGESSFRIKTDQSTVIIDPADKTTGLAQNNLSADVILISQALTIDLKRVKPTGKNSAPFIIKEPGEYETQGIFIYGVPGVDNNIFYLIRTNYLTIAHLAGLSQILNNEQLKLFESADIALVPVGDKGLLSSKQADKVISQIEPKIVIPMNYQVPKLKIEREPIDDFLSEMGVKDLLPETSLHITKSKLPQEETKIVLLQC
jgi:L-ascorbate metabolism protein UlaG (beta-lactamase superfamily)